MEGTAGPHGRKGDPHTVDAEPGAIDEHGTPGAEATGGEVEGLDLALVQVHPLAEHMEVLGVWGRGEGKRAERESGRGVSAGRRISSNKECLDWFQE